MADLELDRVRRLARVLDHGMVDPLLGFILPGVGDLIGSLLGLYIVAVAVRRRVSPVIIARMLLNLALDAGIGVIPIVGDLADLAFKANDKNVALLADRTATGRATARDWLAVGGAALALVGVVALVSYAVAAVFHALG